MSRNSRRVIRTGVSAIVAAGVLSACGGSSGTPSLTWYINPDSGGQAKLAAACAKASDGKYKITTQTLPTDASAQRQQLVTRLAAKDSSISIMSLDPVFVPEFAEAGFLADVPDDYKTDFTANTVKPAIEASTWHKKLIAAPFWANTQLLWYRPSLAKKAGGTLLKDLRAGKATWDQIIDAAQKQRRTVGVQAKLYEGYTVWINALVEGAGGKIVDNPGAIAKNLKLGLDKPAGKKAAAIIGKLASANVGGPALSSNTEPESLALFENPKSSMFLAIWPYIWGAMKADKVKFRDNDVAWTYYPSTVKGRDSRPPFGGIELGVGKAGANQKLAWDAVKCIRTAEHQAQYFLESSNPPANTKAFERADVKKAYPMAALISSSLQRAAPRPLTQYYGDLSTALQQQFSPPRSVSGSTPKKAQTFILQVLRGEKLL